MSGLAGWVAEWLDGWAIIPSVNAYVLVATMAARLELPEKWTGFWIVSGCPPEALVSKQLPSVFQGRLHHTPLRLPLFQSGQNNLSLRRQSQVRSAARQAIPDQRASLLEAYSGSCIIITRK